MSGAARRAQLLDVTKALVSSSGFHAVSIEAVARDAGITRPVVYSHFEDLGALLDALVEREGQRALDQLEDVLPGEIGAGDPREVLLASLRAYLEVAAADPDTWRLVLMPPEGAPSLLRERIALGRAAVLAQLTRVITPGLGAGASPDPELTAHALAAFSDEAVRLTLTDPERYSIERILEHASWLYTRLPS